MITHRIVSLAGRHCAAAAAKSAQASITPGRKGGITISSSSFLCVSGWLSVCRSNCKMVRHFANCLCLSRRRCFGRCKSLQSIQAKDAGLSFRFCSLSFSSPFPSLALSLSRPLSHRVIYLLANAIWHHLRVQRRQRQQHSPTVLSAQQHSTTPKINRRTGGKKV